MRLVFRRTATSYLRRSAAQSNRAMNVIQATPDGYLRSLPAKPYCTDWLGGRLFIRDRKKAAAYAMVQHNSPVILRWMVFDIDCDNAHLRIEDRGCPPPTFIALNRDNGHAHAAYLLDTPVSAFAASSREAIRYCEDIERGLTHKLGADASYAGFLSKNPLSSRWVTEWQAVIPYELDTLNDCLDKSDKRKVSRGEPSAIGRNVSIFDALRVVAYKQCVAFKTAGKSLEDFALMLRCVANATNVTFPIRLSDAEIKSIVRSVAKWVWSRFTFDRLSAIQRDRGKRRWLKSEPLTKTRPWEQLGVSRRTWEKLRATQRQAGSEGLLP